MDVNPPPRLSLGDVWFDQISGELDVAGSRTRLRPQTAAVLTHLLAHEGRVVSREALWRAVWGDTVVTDNSLAQCISEIRRALGPGREAWVETLARRGHLMRLPPPSATVIEPVPATVQPPLPGVAPAPEPVPARPPDPMRSSVATPSLRRWAGAGAAAMLLALTWGAWRAVLPAHPSHLSLAVLPFEVAASGPDAAWFAEVVGEDLTYNLARIPGAHVVARVSTQDYPAAGADLRQIGRDLSVRYLVTGSLHRDGPRVGLHLRLADAATGEIRWADRLDATLTTLQATERQVANRVANALHVSLVRAEAERVSELTGHNADDLALQAWAAWNRGTPAEVSRARDLAQQALALDERSILAWKTLASWHLRARVNQTLPADEAVAGATAAAQRAMDIDPEHPLVHTVWGASLAWRGRYDEAATALAHEIETNPSHPVAYHYLALTRLMQGRPSDAIGLYQQALAISPRDPRLSRFERTLALAYLHDGQLAPAVAHARAATQAAQVDRSAWAMLASVCALARDHPCAQAAVASLRQSWPGFNVAQAEAEWPPVTPAFAAQHGAFVRGLDEAGLAP